METYNSSFTAQDLENAIKAVPSIGANGNWWIGNTDTGVYAGGINVSGAEVGQTIIVKEVDDSGKPTAWEAADLPADSVEMLLDFTTAETVQSFQVPIPDAEMAKKLNDALEIRFWLYVPRDTADTETSTGGKVNIGINRGWNAGMINEVSAIPQPTATWVGANDLFVQYTKAKVDGTEEGAAAIVHYAGKAENQSTYGGIQYMQNSFKAAAGNHFYVHGTQNMAAGTRLKVGVVK